MTIREWFKIIFRRKIGETGSHTKSTKSFLLLMLFFLVIFLTQRLAELERRFREKYKPMLKIILTLKTNLI